MKISFKSLIIIFAVGMMSVVACSDDDGGVEPTPPTTGGGNGGGGNGGGGSQPTPGIFAIINQDSTDFTTYKAVLDTFNIPSKITVTGNYTSNGSKITIQFLENFTGTNDLSSPSADYSVTMDYNNYTFSTKSGELVVTENNDSTVAGTFHFEGNPNAGTDTLLVTDGVFLVDL